MALGTYHWRLCYRPVDLRLIWFSSTHTWRLPKSVEAFITRILELSETLRAGDTCLRAPGTTFTHAPKRPFIAGGYLKHTSGHAFYWLMGNRVFMNLHRCGASNMEDKQVQ